MAAWEARRVSAHGEHARFDHCFKVPSVMDSAICGTLTMVSAASEG
jgi:hypothetical protein